MDLEKKRKRIEGVVKILALLVVGFVVYPFIFMALKGLLALIAAVFVGALALTFTPWIAAKLANWRLKTIKHEAAQNPIETLENQYAKRVEAMSNFKRHIHEFHATLKGMWDEIEKYKSEFPGQACPYEPQYAKMVQLLNNRTAKYKDAIAQLEEFETLIERKRAEWKIAQAAAKMSKAAGVGEDFMSKLMSDTALDSVQNGLNLAFAELETSLLDEVSVSNIGPVVAVPNQIPVKAGPPSLDLDLGAIETVEAEPEYVPIKQRR